MYESQWCLAVNSTHHALGVCLVFSYFVGLFSSFRPEALCPFCWSELSWGHGWDAGWVVPEAAADDSDSLPELAQVCGLRWRQVKAHKNMIVTGSLLKMQASCNDNDFKDVAKRHLNLCTVTAVHWAFGINFFSKHLFWKHNFKKTPKKPNHEWVRDYWRIRSCSWWFVRTCSTWAIMELCMVSICPRSSVNSLCWLRNSIINSSCTSALNF